MIYNLVFHDGKSIEITEQQKEAIYKMSSTSVKGVDINGEYVSFSGISRIEKSTIRPQYPELPTVKEIMQNFTPDKRKRALQSIIKGFKKHFEGREIPLKSQAMLNNWIDRL